MSPPKPDSERPAVGPMIRRLVRWLAREDDATLSAAGRRTAYGLVEGYVSIVINTVLFAVKLALGLITGSIALIADAAHTAADSLTSVVVVISAYVTRRPPDEEHPFGHGRAEAIATVVIAVLLGVAGFEFAKSSVARILDPKAITAPWLIVGIILATAIVKEWLSRFAIRLARASGNRALEADGWHHRSDVFATVLVAGGMISARYGLAVLDGVVGLLVSLLIFKVAYDISKSAIDTLLGAAPNPEEVRQVKDRATAVQGVRGTHDVVIHKYGSGVFISLHVETSDRLSAGELHDLTVLVESAVAQDGHGSVCVHVDPVNVDHPAYQDVKNAVSDTVAGDDDAESYHDLRIVGGEPTFSIVFDLKLRASCREPAAAVQRIKSQLRRHFPQASIAVEVEPAYSY